MTDQPSAVDLEGAPMEAPVDAATATPPEEQQMGEPLGVTAALNIPKKSEAVNPEKSLHLLLHPLMEKLLQLPSLKPLTLLPVRTTIRRMMRVLPMTSCIRLSEIQTCTSTRS